MIGILLYDDVRRRFIVQEVIKNVITEDSRIVELDCGTQLAIRLAPDNWKDTRIEKDSEDDLYGWYFVGLGRVAPLVGHTVMLSAFLALTKAPW